MFVFYYMVILESVKFILSVNYESFSVQNTSSFSTVNFRKLEWTKEVKRADSVTVLSHLYTFSARLSEVQTCALFDYNYV